MKLHRTLGLFAMLAASPFVRSASASAAMDCRDYYFDGFNYHDDCYLTIGALVADCKYYCGETPNEGGGYCSGYHDAVMGSPTQSEGYCQCSFCVT